MGQGNRRLHEKHKRRPRRLGCWLLVIVGVLCAAGIGSGMQRDRARTPTVTRTSEGSATAARSRTAAPTETEMPTPTRTEQEAPSTIMSRILATVGVPTARAFPTLPPALPPTARVFLAPTRAVVSPFACNGVNDLNCEDFDRSGRDAQAHLEQCGDEDDLDRDNDGLACEFSGW